MNLHTTGTTLGTRNLGDGIRYFDPTVASGDLFVWDDGVHIVNEVKITPKGMEYSLACGQTFTFSLPKNLDRKPLEAKIDLPTEPMCKNCLPQFR